MGWIVAAGVVLVVFLFKGRGSRAQASSASPGTVSAQAMPSAAPAAATVPPPAPASPEFTVVPSTSIQPPPGGGEVFDGVLSPPTASVPAEFLAVIRAGGAASDQDLQRAADLARVRGRADIQNYFEQRLANRRAAARTFDIAMTERERGWRPEAGTPMLDADGNEILDAEGNPIIDPGAPLQQLEMVEREVLETPTERMAAARAPERARQSVQTAALPTPRMDRSQLHVLALRVADNLRRTQPRGYDQALMKSFQRGAGLAVDGDYGDRTRQALGYYGQIPAAQLPASQY